MLNTRIYLFVFLQLCTYNSLITSTEVLTIFENGLPETEKTHSIVSALLAIENSTNKYVIATSIVNQMTYRFGGNWNSFVTNRTTSGDTGSALQLKSKELIHFEYETYEILIFKLQNMTSNVTNNLNFAHVLSEAKQSHYKENYLKDYNHSMSTMYVIVNNSIVNQDFSNCQKHIVSWVDKYGDCYQLMADYIQQQLDQKLPGKWSVTVGEHNSHFQSTSDNFRAVAPLIAQFNYANLHFNIFNLN